MQTIDEYELCCLVIRSCLEAMVVLTTDGKIVYANPAFQRLSGRDESELRSLHIWNLLDVHNEARDLVASSFISRLKLVDSSWIDVDVNITQLASTPFKTVLCSIRDITDARKREQQLLHDAMHDPLTGLPNRRLLLDRLEQAIVSSERRAKDVSILFIDVDDFKRINENFGHTAADQVLIQIAERLRQSVRRSDTVARIGGDEFAIVASDMSGAPSADCLSRRVLNAFSEPFIVENERVSISISIGVSMAPRDGITIDDLLTKSDTAMYRAKKQGGNQFVHHHIT